ncbi:histidine kinase [Pedobacter sp. PF22-3]|uniref:sensor histidine kinase n=1 Tax=Pedobacter sp. PF22-3 TaxID=2994467 RepID=UPI002245899C|nr:histidine kinase [Pedobacter sp. PF22-3]MCX2494825.1 histidine kinase [Pedobacter sp. PF22-3]
MSKKKNIFIYHVIFWLVYMSLSSLMEFAGDPKNYFFSLPDFIFTQFPNICTFYLSLLVYSKYATPVKILPLIAGLILVYAFSSLNWYVTGFHIRPLIRANGGPTPQFVFWRHLMGTFWVFIRYSTLAFGYYYAREGIKYQKKLRLIEKEKHEAEYAFLRAQINPHFLNNTLNFFFAKSLPLSEELANGIMTLSQIMRYSLEIDKDDRMTLIDEEIEHIKNVIKINQLRFNNKLQIDFNVNGNTDSVRLIPLILITIVENILKHGNCTEHTHPVKITLSIDQINHNIQLSTWNKKKNGPKELSSGIGMENIKKRLSNHYKKGIILTINETETDYSLELTIPYNKVMDHQEKPKSTDNLDFLQHFQLPKINPQPYTS